MNVTEIYQALYGEKKAEKTAEETKSASISKLAEDIESVYAAGQIYGAGIVDGLIKRAADLVSNSVDTKAETGNEPYAEDAGGRGSMVAETKVPQHDSSGPTGKEESESKHITQVDPAVSGPTPDEKGEGELTDGAAGGGSHPGIKGTLKSLQDSFDKEIQ